MHTTKKLRNMDKRTNVPQQGVQQRRQERPRMRFKAPTRVIACIDIALMVLTMVATLVFGGTVAFAFVHFSEYNDLNKPDGQIIAMMLIDLIIALSWRSFDPVTIVLIFVALQLCWFAVKMWVAIKLLSATRLNLPAQQSKDAGFWRNFHGCLIAFDIFWVMISGVLDPWTSFSTLARGGFIVVVHMYIEELEDSVVEYGREPEPEMNTVNVPMSQIMSGEPIILEQDDKRIIDYIWKHQVLVPPSEQPYNLDSPDKNKDPSAGQAEFIRKLLGNMTNGFFVEAGTVYNGECLSNTLFMERNLNWKGLLVEGDPINYAKLKSKNRKAWISNTFLAMKPYPHKATFKQDDVLGQIVNKSKSGDKVIEVQCMPLFSLLTALNVSTVDYFSLNVEGGELKVLKTIPFDKVFIRALSVQNALTPEGKRALQEFMREKGYKVAGEMLRDDVDDVFFIHQKSIMISR